MRNAHASVALSVLVCVAVAGLPTTTWAGPQDNGDNGTAVGSGEPDKTAKPEPEAEGKGAGEKATAGGTAQALEVASGFGRLLGSVQVTGDVQVGYRYVAVSGSEDKYREQYDFDDGVRILSTRVVISPEQRNAGRAFDRVTLSANGLGGDPYETWSVSAYKTGAYRADVRYRSVDYFYGDPGDVHAWDTQRKYVDVNLSANISRNVLVNASFNGYRRTGERTTTRDFDRDEFHFDEPIDQEGTDYGFGIRWNLKGTDLFFNQRFVNFRDDSGFTSGPNAGGSTATFIEMLANTEVRAMDAPISRGGFHSILLSSRVELFGDLMYSNQQTSSAFVQLIDGTDRSSNAIRTTWDNQGSVERDVLHGNLEVRVRAHRVVIVTAKYRHRDWDQDGHSIGEDVTVRTELGTFVSARGVGLSSYRVKGDQLLFGVEVMPARSINIFGEVGYGSVDKSFKKEEIDGFPRGSDRATDVTTNTVPFRIGGFYRPDPRVDVKVTYSRADVDDPLTQVFPTVADGIKLRSRFRPAPGWTVAGDVTYRTAKNAISDHEFDSTTFGASLSYAVSDRGHVSVGYTYLDSASSVPFSYVQSDRTLGQSVSSYEAQTNVFTLTAGYSVSESTPVKVYGSIAWVDNNGTIPLSRYDAVFGGRYIFSDGIFVDAQVRFIDFQQEFFHEQGIILSPPEPSTVNDFDAKLFTISMGFRFH